MDLTGFSESQEVSRILWGFTEGSSGLKGISRVSGVSGVLQVVSMEFHRISGLFDEVLEAFQESQGISGD